MRHAHLALCRRPDVRSLEGRSEIALRLYLTIGFVALLGLTALAVDLDRRHGAPARRQALAAPAQRHLRHRLLALIHFFQQTKADVSVPTFVAGLFGWMIGYRLLIKFRKTRGEPPAWMLLALSVASRADVHRRGDRHRHRVQRLAVRVLRPRFDFDDLAMIRPGWLVLGAA
jgi:sulfoxide reductase heme-binding subunit YedZ